ncbi:MAG: AlpA family phage regulatory protein [Hyphomicrobiales bacterium]|nr:AlpA family phage regulatory protein [Hyphomicrobiales bacterium]
MASLKLPHKEYFTRKELTERWKCDLSLIDHCIKTGKLKEGFDSNESGYHHLRKLWYFVCDDDGWSTEKLLDAIEDGKPLSAFTRLATTVSCPRYLYMSPLPNARGEVKEPNPFNLVGNILFLCSFYDVPVRFFHDSKGNVLIPVKEMDGENYITFPSIPKRRFNFVIPLEEVLRFESENPIGETNQDVPATVRQEKMPKKEREDSESTAPETSDNIPGNRPPPARKPPLTKKEVADRIGISVSHVENLRKQEDFPKSFSITGGRLIGWDEDEIDQWIEERKKQRGEPINEAKKPNE